jgi:hypothetical protein
MRINIDRRIGIYPDVALDKPKKKKHYCNCRTKSLIVLSIVNEA